MVALSVCYLICCCLLSVILSVLYLICPSLLSVILSVFVVCYLICCCLLSLLFVILSHSLFVDWLFTLLVSDSFICCSLPWYLLSNLLIFLCRFL